MQALVIFYQRTRRELRPLPAPRAVRTALTSDRPIIRPVGAVRHALYLQGDLASQHHATIMGTNGGDRLWQNQLQMITPNPKFPLRQNPEFPSVAVPC
jgi:hypothetical protein